jgi:hypothetical protein
LETATAVERAVESAVQSAKGWGALLAVEWVLLLAAEKAPGSDLKKAQK